MTTVAPDLVATEPGGSSLTDQPRLDPLHVIGAALQVVAVAGTLAVAVALVVGYRPVVLTTSSMAPTAPAGSLLIVESQPAETVEVGDMVVMARANGTLVTHRVIALNTAGPNIAAITKGDANPIPDSQPYVLSDDQYVVRYVVPAAGRVLAPLLGPGVAFGLLVAIVLAMALLIIGWVKPRSLMGRKNQMGAGADSST
ncbi:MAG: signal peptidase I [Actinomycetota bacterium]